MDRDGVINLDTGYIGHIDEVVFVEGIFEMVRRFREAGYLIIIVTNQSGIARGLFTLEDFETLMAWMRQTFEAHHATIDAVYMCPHHPDITGPCSCRKPAPGMLIDAQKAWDIDMSQSIMVGDSPRDIEAAQKAGVGHQFLLHPSATSTLANGGIIRQLHDLQVPHA